jgi:hypothetical protein
MTAIECGKIVAFEANVNIIHDSTKAEIVEFRTHCATSLNFKKLLELTESFKF